MILYKNVCDNCGTEELIDEDSKTFSLHFTTLSVYDESVKRKFHGHNTTKVSFCGVSCASSWFSDNLDIYGEIKLNGDCNND